MGVCAQRVSHFHLLGKKKKAKAACVSATSSLTTADADVVTAQTVVTDAQAAAASVALTRRKLKPGQQYKIHTHHMPQTGSKLTRLSAHSRRLPHATSMPARQSPSQELPLVSKTQFKTTVPRLQLLPQQLLPQQLLPQQQQPQQLLPQQQQPQKQQPQKQPQQPRQQPRQSSHRVSRALQTSISAPVLILRRLAKGPGGQVTLPICAAMLAQGKV